MAIKYKPSIGTILICDFGDGVYPEINKRRPVIVLSSVSSNLCIVVPTSTTAPRRIREWHYRLQLPEPLPPPYESPVSWVKCDIVATVSFSRLNFPLIGRDDSGKRDYDFRIIEKEEMERIFQCVKAALFRS